MFYTKKKTSENSFRVPTYQLGSTQFIRRLFRMEDGGLYLPEGGYAPNPEHYGQEHMMGYQVNSLNIFSLRFFNRLFFCHNFFIHILFGETLYQFLIQMLSYSFCACR